jgi:NAD(P)-dependent dehydrogenase (short-subunit alcohol dehydrogenase family)
MQLEGKVAIVTGGARGIGKAIAEALAGQGAHLLVADQAGAAATAGQLASANGTKAIGVEVNVASEADTARMAKAALDAFGRIDVLVNNAGIYSTLTPGPFEEISAADWRRVMDVNVMGVFLCCRAVIGTMRSQESGGRIINIASGTPFKGVPYLLHYTTSKGAVVALTRALAREVGGAGVLVNAVAPGFTLSDGVLANPAQLDALQGVSLKARTILRDQYPADIVGAVKFFAGPDSAFITGQTLVVDGGAYFH